MPRPPQKTPTIQRNRLLFSILGLLVLVLVLQILLFANSLTAELTPKKTSSSPPPAGGYAPDRVIIKMKQGYSVDETLLNQYGLKNNKKLLQGLSQKFSQKNAAVKVNIEGAGMDRLHLLSIDNGVDPQTVAASLKSDSRVEYAEPDYTVSALNTPNDPSFGQLWGLNNTGQSGGTPDADIDAPEAWNITTGSPTGIVVGVIDTGIDYNHPDLAANIWTNPGEIPGNGIDDDGNGYIDDVHGYDFANNDGDPMDDNNHGTHCAGTIAGVGNNGVGVTGVNWKAKVAALKFLKANGTGNISDAVRALIYATTMGFKVTSNSWGGGGFSLTMSNAITAAKNAGFLFVAAAGNSATNIDGSPFYPASYSHPNVIAVAATNRNDALATFSNYGAVSVDLSAPGVDIYSTLRNGGYALFSGTSMATPHVAGAAVLLWNTNTSLGYADVKNKILTSVDALPSLTGKVVSNGRLNICKMLNGCLSSSSSSSVASFSSASATSSSSTPSSGSSSSGGGSSAPFSSSAPSSKSKSSSANSSASSACKVNGSLCKSASVCCSHTCNHFKCGPIQ